MIGEVPEVTIWPVPPGNARTVHEYVAYLRVEKGMLVIEARKEDYPVPASATKPASVANAAFAVKESNRSRAAFLRR